MCRIPLRARASLLCLALLSAGCALPRPYTLDIQQGVVLDQKMLSRLKPGMTRNQVGLTLGTPLLADPYHADRWDYVYYTRVRGVVGEWRRITLRFRDDRLATISGDVRIAPAGEGESGPALPDAPAKGLPAPSPDASGPQPKS